MVRRDFYVYALFRQNGDPFYIGKGTGRRWTAHERYLDRSRKSNIIRAVKRDLGHLPKEKLADGLTDAEARDLEITLIRLVGRSPAGPLVNLTDGGDGASNPSDEARRKMSERQKSRPRTAEERQKIADSQRGKKLSPEFLAVIGSWNKGRVASEETRRKLSKARTGRKLSDETKAKIGAAHRGRKKTPEQIEKHRQAITGRKASPETIEKLRLAKIGKKRGPYKRRTAEHTGD